MECELERGQRICPDCNVRHIGCCQEDVDRWRIREIVGDWWPYQGGEGFDGCVTDVWSGKIGNRFWDVLFDSLF